MKPFAILFMACLAASTLPAGETHSLTLKQAVALALRQSPEVVMARLDLEKAQLGVRVARDPFIPKVYAGSGLAYTYGYPNTIEGSAPSILQVRTDMAIYNRSRSYDLAKARENARGIAFDAQSKTDDIVYRTASIFLDAQDASRGIELANHEIESLLRVRDIVASRIQEGRELPLAGRRAEVDLARARQNLQVLTANLSYYQGSLAMVLGFPPGDRVETIADDSLAASLEKSQPSSGDDAAQSALSSSRSLKSLESQLASKSLEIRSQRAARLPQVNLVAQYALFLKSTYQGYYTGNFQRNNAQLGVDITLPLLVGSAASAQAAQAEADVQHIREQVLLERNRVSLDARRAFDDIKTLDSARNLAKLDLEVARDQLSLLLSQMDEGRASTQQVDLARVAEQEKWSAFYSADSQLELARMNLLRQTGSLVAALR